MIDKFIKEFTKAAEGKGINNLEFYIETVEKYGVTIYEGEIEGKSFSNISTCYIEGEYSGNKGYVYVEDFAKEYYEEHIQNICQIAKALKQPFIAKQLENITKEQSEILSGEVQIEQMLLKAEKQAMSDSLIKKVPRCYGEETIRKVRLQNSKDQKMEDVMKYVVCSIELTAEDNGVVQTIGEEIYAKDIAKIELDKMVSSAKFDAIAILNAKPVKTERYRVVLKHSIVTEMIEMYIGSFCGDNVRKKLSKIANMIGEEIASKSVNLVELPTLPDGINNRRFDDEGTKTQEKEIIKKGILQTFLYNKEEAELSGLESTGNGFKTNYKSAVGIKVSNLKLYSEKENTLEEMLESMDNGLYIISCDGMFAGADPVSGDFSLISKGYLVENGKKKQGVNQITVAGNFYEMLKDIKSMGNDYHTIMSGSGVVIAPSIELSSLVISGL